MYGWSSNHLRTRLVTGLRAFSFLGMAWCGESRLGRLERSQVRYQQTGEHSERERSSSAVWWFSFSSGTRVQPATGRTGCTLVPGVRFWISRR